MNKNKLGQFVETIDIEHAARLHKQGMSIAAVSNVLNVSKAAISYAFKRHGIDILTRSHPKINLSKEEIIDKLKAGQSIRSLSTTLGVSDVALRKRMQKHGINIKDIINERDKANQQTHDIKDGPRLVGEYKPIDNNLMAIIVGIYLGDSHISKSYDYMKSHLEYGHAADQGDYVRLVHKLLQPLCMNRSIVVKASTTNLNEDTFYRFRTCYHETFIKMREKYYEDNFFPDGSAIKRFDIDLLNHMDNRSLALFYMDDGFYSNWDNRIKVGFCTNNFHIDDIKLLQKFLIDKFNVHTSIESKNKDLVTGHTITINYQSLELFENAIVPYIIKCNRDKFPGEYVIPPWDDNPDYESDWDKIVSGSDPLPKPRLPKFISRFSKTTELNVVNDEFTTSPVTYTVSEASRIEVANFLEKHHYLGRPPHHSKYYFKLEHDNVIVGAAAFASLRAAAMGDNIFNIKVSPSCGLEVSRFACLDNCGKNTESFFLSECIGGLSKVDSNVKYLITYSQPELGHHGYVYQATNWIYVSDVAGGKVKYYLDNKPISRGRLKKIHGASTGRAEWRKIYNDRIEYRNLPSKYKYIYVIDKNLKHKLVVPYLSYPKAASDGNIRG